MRRLKLIKVQRKEFPQKKPAQQQGPLENTWKSSKNLKEMNKFVDPY